MNQTLNSDTPPTEQRAKSNLLPEEKDGRILLFAKINSYIDDFDLVFYYLPFPCSSACNKPYEIATEPKPQWHEPCKQFFACLETPTVHKAWNRVKFRDFILRSWYHLQPLKIPLSIISTLFYVFYSTDSCSSADVSNFLDGNLLDAVNNTEPKRQRGAL